MVGIIFIKMTAIASPSAAITIAASPSCLLFIQLLSTHKLLVIILATESRIKNGFRN